MKRNDLGVLVVDDREVDRKYILATLRHMGFKKVQEAENGKVAEFKISNSLKLKSPFQLILIDWDMPKANGLAVLRYIRTQESLKSTVVFMVTATASAERVSNAIKFGANEFIVKPFYPIALADKLKPYFDFE